MAQTQEKSVRYGITKVELHAQLIEKSISNDFTTGSFYRKGIIIPPKTPIEIIEINRSSEPVLISDTSRTFYDRVEIQERIEIIVNLLNKRELGESYTCHILNLTANYSFENLEEVIETDVDEKTFEVLFK